MAVSLHETCQQYVARRLSEGWRIVERKGFNVILQSPEGILRPVDLRNDIETLRPSASGDDCKICYEYGCSACPNHYDCVDEESSDLYLTTVWTDTTTYERDLYNIEDHSVGSGPIKHITVHAHCYSSGPVDQASLKIAIKSTNVHESAEKTITTGWVDYSEKWETNPDNSHAWTWDEIDSLQIGVALRTTDPSYSYGSYCTQVYVEVDYTPAAPPAAAGGAGGLAAAAKALLT